MKKCKVKNSDFLQGRSEMMKMKKEKAYRGGLTVPKSAVVFLFVESVRAATDFSVVTRSYPQ